MEASGIVWVYSGPEQITYQWKEHATWLDVSTVGLAYTEDKREQRNLENSGYRCSAIAAPPSSSHIFQM